jgi:hypothetical protein
MMLIFVAGIANRILFAHDAIQAIFSKSRPSTQPVTTFALFIILSVVMMFHLQLAVVVIVIQFSSVHSLFRISEPAAFHAHIYTM